MSPRAPKDQPPKRCEEYAACGNYVRVRQATWCPPCRAKRDTGQRQVSNKIAYDALRSPGSVVLAPDQASTLSEDLGLLAAAWNSYARAGPEDEPVEREHLHQVLGGVLAELWADMPKTLLSWKPPERGGG